MKYEISVVKVAPTLFASQHKRVTWPRLTKTIAEAFESMTAFLAANPDIKPQGQNICLYRSASSHDVEIEVGVQVAAKFEPRGDVTCSSTPGGKAARTAHTGGTATLGEAHRAVAAWCAPHGHTDRGVSWELYGEDAIEVFHQVSGGKERG